MKSTNRAKLANLVKPMDQYLRIYCIPLGMMEHEVFRMDYENSSCTNIHKYMSHKLTRIAFETLIRLNFTPNALIL